MMTVAVKGKTRADAEALIQEFRDMATGKLDPERSPTTRPAHRVRRRARPADARQMRDPAVAHAACGVQFGQRSHRPKRMPIRCTPDRRMPEHIFEDEMPKIAEIESTPNPNAMKFILKEPLTWGDLLVRKRRTGAG